VGTNTGIDYGKDFEQYLEILLIGLRKKKKSILNVFREWDRIIFPNSDSGMVSHDQDTRDGNRKRAITMLEDDEDENEAEENGDAVF
jgi:hypothetical protein